MSLRSITIFLIRKSYLKSFYDKIDNSSSLFNQTAKEVHFEKGYYFVLKILNELSIQQIFHTEKQKLFVFKKNSQWITI